MISEQRRALQITAGMLQVVAAALTQGESTIVNLNMLDGTTCRMTIGAALDLADAALEPEKQHE